MAEKYHYKIILATVIFNEKGQILLGKRGKTEEVLPEHWGIPGGKIEALGNISDILEKELKREVMEEVGIKIKDIKYFEGHMHESGKINLCFTSKIEEEEPRALDETEEVKWFYPEEIKDMLLTPHTLERVELAISKNN